MRFHKLGLILASGALLAGGTAATAQAQPSPAPAQAQRDGMRPRLTPEQRAERRAERLRAILQLRPEQEPALRAFLDSRRPAEGARQRMRGQRQEMAQLTTPQRLDRRAERMAERQARFEQRAAATKRFYAQLTPAQQKAFDALGRGGGRGKGGHRGGWGHGPRG